MDTPEKPRRRWRKAVGIGLLLVMPYPASFGPAAYAAGRLWIDPYHFERAYAPLTDAAHLTPLWPLVWRYHLWWLDAAIRAEGEPPRKFWPLYSTRRPSEYP